MQAIIELKFYTGWGGGGGSGEGRGLVSVTRHFGGQFAFVKHLLEGGRLFVSCTGIFRVFFRFPAFH